MPRHSRGQLAMRGRFRFIATDIDGCVGRGEAMPYDLQVLERLGELNRRARRGDPVPAVTLCTGRPAAYVDAMLQTIDGFLPAIYENGAGLYFPQGYRFAWNPAIPAAARGAILHVRERVHQYVIQTGVGYIQPGKELAVTLFPTPGHTLEDVGQAALAALEGQNLPCHVEVSVTSVGIWLDGVNKGAGIQWLADETRTPLETIVGVGDAPGDVCFLRLVGLSAAPANAEPEVKAYVDYVSPYEYGRGLLDIVDKVLRREAA